MTTTPLLVPTAMLPEEVAVGARALMDAAFRRYSDEDWSHAQGGLHAYVVEGGRVVAHGSLGQRRLLVGEQTVRCGYVESVAVAPDRQRRGLGGAVMAALETLAPGYDLLALSASTAGRPLYEARGWVAWRGPTSVLTPHGVERTPDDDDAVLVLDADRFDLDLPLTCDWRDGDVW